MMTRAIGVVALCAVALQTTSQQKIDGRGDTVSSPVTLRDGLLMVGAGHKGARNFMLDLEPSGPAGTSENLVNTIGAYKGVRLIAVKAGGYRFTVKADGAWVLLFEQPDAAKVGTPLPVTHSATGDQAIGPFQFAAGSVVLKLTHSGKRNFVATIHPADGRDHDLLVNEIGAYSGSVLYRARQAGRFYLGVEADGPWTVSLSAGAPLFLPQN